MTNSLQETISRLKDLNYEEDEAMENCKALDHAILVLQRVLDAGKELPRIIEENGDFAGEDWAYSIDEEHIKKLTNAITAYLKGEK